MPKRSSKKQGPSDLNEVAFRIMQQAIGESDGSSDASQKNPAAVALGKLGGKKGGRARAQNLSPERRAEIARHAAEVRWRAK